MKTFGISMLALSSVFHWRVFQWHSVLNKMATILSKTIGNFQFWVFKPSVTADERILFLCIFPKFEFCFKASTVKLVAPCDSYLTGPGAASPTSSKLLTR